MMSEGAYGVEPASPQVTPTLGETGQVSVGFAVSPAEFNPHGELERVLALAFEQSAIGKGKERHGNGKPFVKQPILEIGRMVGIGYQTGQIMKKAQEATTMASRGNHQGAKGELLGIIVYAAAAYLLAEEQES